MRIESVNVHQVLRSFLDVISAVFILVLLTLAIETELKKILRPYFRFLPYLAVTVNYWLGFFPSPER